jgi:hypothetical protein
MRLKLRRIQTKRKTTLKIGGHERRSAVSRSFAFAGLPGDFYNAPDRFLLSRLRSLDIADGDLAGFELQFPNRLCGNLQRPRSAEHRAWTHP